VGDVSGDVTGVTVRRTTSLPYQVDGDHLGDAAELRMHHRPDALSVVVPDSDRPETRRRSAGRTVGPRLWMTAPFCESGFEEFRHVGQAVLGQGSSGRRRV
jgi:hypothetical protein